jgi:hypothetical protein
MLVDYLEEQRTGYRKPAWSPVTVSLFQDPGPFESVHTEGYMLTLSASVTFQAPRSDAGGYEAARKAAERKLVAYMYKDARAHLEAVVSAIQSQDQAEAMEACAALRRTLGA